MPSNFRAIIIGGGPVGLVIANGLARADIDFLVVERHPEIVTEDGAGIMLWPHSVRVFDQLGLLENCEGRYIPLWGKTTTRLDGSVLRSAEMFAWMGENHGYDVRNMSRPFIIQTLVEGLAASASKIRTGAGIEDIEMTEDGVRVRLSDGSVEEGSIVIGADGVHSKTREIMQRLAREAGHDIAKEEDPIVSNYQIMYGRAKYIPGVETSTFFETHGTHRSSQISASRDRMHYGIYRKLPTPSANNTKPKQKKRYSEAEVAEFVECFADVRVTPDLTFAELYANSEWTRLVDQHEGLLRHWYFGRVVLAGDACAQMTSAAGLGVNNGIQSAVVLVNKLHNLIIDQKKSKVARPDILIDTEMLGEVFETYQNVRREESRALCAMAANMIRINTWDSYKSWFVGDVVVPALVSQRMMIDKAGTMIVSSAPKFDFLEGGVREGKMPWGK